MPTAESAICPHGMRLSDHTGDRVAPYWCDGSPPEPSAAQGGEPCGEALTDTRVVTLNGARVSGLRKRDYLDRVTRGGFPEAIHRSPRRRTAFFDSYLTSLIERDVQELAAIERRGDLRRLLALLAGRSAACWSPPRSQPRPASPAPR